MADIILPGKIRPLASSLDPDLDALSDHERLAVDKQQRLTDVIKIGRLELDADRRFGETFDALKQDGGISAPDFLSRADGEGDWILQEVTEAIPGEVSGGAREAFLRTLGNRRKDFDLDIDALRGVTRTRDGLALVEDVVTRAVDTVQREPFRLKARLDDLDRMAGDMGTALAPLREDALMDRRAAIVTAAIKGMVARGQGDKAQLLLDSGVLDDRLGADRLARLKQTAASLTQAYDQDRRDQEHLNALEDSRARQAKAHAVTAAVRTRIRDGDAIETKIAAAETEGVLSPAQANRLRAEATAARERQNAIAARIDRVTSMLDAGARPNPLDPDTRNDIALHYDATVKPTLAGLDPARKAAAISGYVAETGIAPETALDTLMALAPTGDPADRISAARDLASVFTTDPTSHGRVPPKLAEYAETVIQLADLDALTPEDIVTNAESVFGVGNADPDGPNPALVHLATARANDGEETAKLLDEIQTIRDSLADDGDGANTALVASIDELVGAVERRDQGRIEDLIEQFEQNLSQDKTSLPDSAPSIDLAALDDIRMPFLPTGSDDDSLLGKVIKALELILILKEIARRRDQKQPQAEETPASEQQPDIGQNPTKVGTDSIDGNDTSEQAERTARAEGLEIQKKLGLVPSGNIKQIGERIVRLASDKFQNTKKAKISLTVPEIGAGANEQSAIQAFVNAYRNQALLPDRNDNVVSLNLGHVDRDLAARVKAETNIDLTGLNDTIDTVQLDHVFKGHGPGNEINPNQIPVSPEAIANYRYVVQNYDHISMVRPGKGSGGTIHFEKQINGVAVVVQQVRRGKDEFAFFTMFIKRRKKEE